jgi:hypothetical protein
MLAQIYWFWQTMHQNRQLHCWLFLVDLLQLNKLFFFPCKRILTSIAPYGIIWSAHKLGPFCNISYYDQARFPKLLRCASKNTEGIETRFSYIIKDCGEYLMALERAM